MPLRVQCASTRKGVWFRFKHTSDNVAETFETLQICHADGRHRQTRVSGTDYKGNRDCLHGVESVYRALSLGLHRQSSPMFLRKRRQRTDQVQVRSAAVATTEGWRPRNQSLATPCRQIGDTYPLPTESVLTFGAARYRGGRVLAVLSKPSERCLLELAAREPPPQKRRG
jgi:hypothetical protein